MSADIVSTNADGQPAGSPGKVYVSNDKVRIETPDVASGFFIVDGATNAAFLCARHNECSWKRQTVELPYPNPCSPRSGRPLPKMAGNGRERGCNRDRQPMALQPDRPSDHRGPRDHKLYRCVATEKANTQWIDPGPEFLVRSQTDNGIVIDLTNIQEGPQPASLFQIPVSYSKFDPRRLIEIIKRSDVWVEPNK